MRERSYGDLWLGSEKAPVQLQLRRPPTRTRAAVVCFSMSEATTGAAGLPAPALDYVLKMQVTPSTCSRAVA